MCAAWTSLATSCIRSQEKADDGARTPPYRSDARALGGNHGLALGGLDGVEQVEAAVISALCYLQT